MTRDSDDTGRISIVRSWHVDTEDEIDTVVGANGSYRGITRSPSYHAETWSPDTIDAGFRVDLTFSGVDLQYGRNSPEKAKWNFSPGFEKEPIEKHPDISEIIEIFDGREDEETGRVSFPRLYYASANDPRDGSRHWYSSGGGGGGSTLANNPLFGLGESGYLSVNATASARYNSTSLAAAQRDIGSVLSRLPYNAPEYALADGRDWLKVPAQIDEIDPVEGQRWYAIEEQFILSAKGGWPPSVYEFIEI